MSSPTRHNSQPLQGLLCIHHAPAQSQNPTPPRITGIKAPAPNWPLDPSTLDFGLLGGPDKFHIKSATLNHRQKRFDLGHQPLTFRWPPKSSLKKIKKVNS